MSVVKPLAREEAAPEVHEIYDLLVKKMGKVPNFFGTMAHRPEVLKKFVPLYNTIIQEGTVEARFKELAYLKAAMTNGCEY